MARKRHTAEEIVAKLRQVQLLVSQGKLAADAVRVISVTEATYYRWQEYGGLKGDQVRRLKELETENARLRWAVSDLTVERQILKEAARETSEPRPPPRLRGSRCRRAQVCQSAWPAGFWGNTVPRSASARRCVEPLQLRQEPRDRPSRGPHQRGGRA